MKGKWIFKGIGFAILVALGITAFGFVFMHLWNWLMPNIFGFKVIDWYQGMGLLILGKMLFGGWKGRGGRGSCHGHCGHRGYYGGWKNKWKQKMMDMSPEEREKFKAKMKEKCGMSFEDDEQKQDA